MIYKYITDPIFVTFHGLNNDMTVFEGFLHGFAFTRKVVVICTRANTAPPSNSRGTKFDAELRMFLQEYNKYLLILMLAMLQQQYLRVFYLNNVKMLQIKGTIVISGLFAQCIVSTLLLLCCSQDCDLALS